MKNRINLAKKTLGVFGKNLTLYGYETDGYFKHLIEDESPDLDVISLASLLISEDSNVFDIGANIGYESVIFALLASKGTVQAFEPVPQNAEIIKKNLAANNVKNVTVHNVGLGSKKNIFTIVFNDLNRGGATLLASGQEDLAKVHENSQKVKVLSLDSLSKFFGKNMKVDLIKVDIEGHEPEFLKGSAKFINKHRPSMIIEANHWCLNGLNRISLPDFIDQITSIYPHVAAFDNNQWIDLAEDRHQFMHENIVKNRFQNLYCEFDKTKWQKIINQHQWGWLINKNLILELSSQIEALEQKNADLIKALASIRTEKKMSPRKLPRRIINKLRNI